MKTVIAFCLIALLTGCATTVESKPGKITLEQAMSSLGRGLVQLKQAQIQQNNGQDFKSGLLPAEAEVTFNVTASGEQSGKLFVEVSNTPVSKAGADIGTSYSASRGNQITVKFRNIAFSKTTTGKDTVTVEGVTDPEVLARIIKALEDSGITWNFQTNME